MRNIAPSLRLEVPATLQTEHRRGTFRIVAGGDWLVAEAPRLDEELQRLEFAGGGDAEIDGSGIHLMDSSGAWLLLRTKRQLEEQGKRVGKFDLPDVYRPLIEKMEQARIGRAAHESGSRSFRDFLERMGKATVDAVRQGYAMLSFLGQVTIETSEAVMSPRRELPWAAFVHQIEETGINALPIVGLLAFLLGVTLAYQGADQLERFGAQIYTIDFLGVGFLRELGGLVTAIIIAGRSGSAFTASIGSMRVNEEVDAMQAIGLNVAETLVLPRVLGLVVALPILTLFADAVGIIGGMVMCYFNLGFTVPVFMRELEGAITTNTLMVGLIKAPVFAFMIALVGCFEGLRVERNAESVGRLTTRSVVESIFLIIAADAGFSVLFSILDI